MMIASQFRYGLDFLAAAVRAKVRMKVAGEQGAQIMAD
jgi:hypothetical protein